MRSPQARQRPPEPADLGPEDLSRATRPLVLELLLNGRRLRALSLFRHGWLSLLAEVPEELSRAQDFELELRASHTWRPRPDDPNNRDDRELSIAVCNIEAFVCRGVEIHMDIQDGQDKN